MINRFICWLVGHQKLATPEVWNTTKRGHCPRCSKTMIKPKQKTTDLVHVWNKGYHQGVIDGREEALKENEKNK